MKDYKTPTVPSRKGSHCLIPQSARCNSADSPLSKSGARTVPFPAENTFV